MIDCRILVLVFLSFGDGICGPGIPTRTPRHQFEEYCNGPIVAFNNTDKRNPDYILGTNETPLNDVKWLDFVIYGEPGIAVYVGPDPGANHCGTKNPIYGKNVTQETKNVFRITLCFTSEDGPEWYSTLYVFCENLGHYIYYYYNPKVLAMSAFCTVTEISVSVPTPIEEAGKLKYRFLCEFNVSTTDKFWYTVKWYKDGLLIKINEPFYHSDDISQRTLLREDMLGTNSLGFKIQCSYAVSLQVDSELGYERRSQDKFVGIEILTPIINIQDGQQTEIQIRSTVPFGCSATQPNCALVVNIMDPSASTNNPNCDPASSFSTCGIKIPSDQWNKVFTLTISADAATQYGNNFAVNTVFLQTSDFPSHGIWQNYNIGSVVIRNSQDTSKIEGPFCAATGDPYIRTFGAGHGKWYEHQYEGVFTLYQNAKWKQEVQITTAPCRRSRDDGPTCICGAAISVGKEVFVIDRCDPLTYWSVAYTQCSDSNIALMDITRYGFNYKFKLPSGLILETRLFISSKFLNLYLYPSEADVSAVGLCGALSSDLFKKRDGSVVTYQYPGMPDFSDSWRVTPEVVDLFSDDITALADLPTGGYFCKCTTPVGSTEPQFTCAKPSYACAASLGYYRTVTGCHVQVNKRSVPNNRFVRSIQPQHYIRKRATLTWRNGWDQAKAESYCDSVHSNSTLVQKCQKIGNNIDFAGPRENCFRDIEYMADTSFALVYIESIASQCEREVIYNTTFHTAAAGQTPLLDQIKEVLCPLDCSYHGVCVKGRSWGRCQCNTGWSGVDCSLDLSIIPLVDHVDQLGHCDLFKDQCLDISVFGGDFVDTSTKCRIVAQQLSEAGEFNSKTEREELSTVESIGEVKCPLSVSNRKRRSVATKPEEKFVQVYSVSVSNNGAAYSDPSLVVVFNSRCQFCTISNDQVQCNYTGDYCFSGGNCYGKGESHLVHKSYTCSVNNGVREWILSEEDDLAWIAGVVIGIFVAVVIVVGVAYYLIKKKKSQVSPPEEPNKSSPPPYSTDIDQQI